MDDDITPMERAYRNLDTRGLIQRAAGKHGPNKSLAVPARASPTGPAHADAVARALSYVTDVFVVDAAVGSFRGSEVLVRAVTDDAAVALFLQHLLVRTGGGSTAETGSSHPIQVRCRRTPQSRRRRGVDDDDDDDDADFFGVCRCCC